MAEQILFIKRLALFVKAGVPIVQGLQIIQTQSSTRSAGIITKHLVHTVEHGGYISTALSKYRQVFGDFVLNIIEIGELSGTLPENLNYLSEELKKKQQLRRKIRGSMVYPALILVATVGIVVLLVGYVFPKISPLFSSFNFQLPWTSRALIAASSFLRQSWYWLSSATIGLVCMTIVGLRYPRIRLILHGLMARLPLFGTLVQSYHIANITRTLGLLLKNNIPIVKAVAITSQTTTNECYLKALLRMQHHLTNGETLAVNFGRYPRLFPELTAHMLAVGESTGNLSSTLLFLSENYENDLEEMTKNLSTMIEPVLMIGIGLVVGFIALAIITPIYGVTQHIHP